MGWRKVPAGGTGGFWPGDEEAKPTWEKFWGHGVLQSRGRDRELSPEKCGETKTGSLGRREKPIKQEFMPEDCCGQLRLAPNKGSGGRGGALRHHV